MHIVANFSIDEEDVVGNKKTNARIKSVCFLGSAFRQKRFY